MDAGQHAIIDTGARRRAAVSTDAGGASGANLQYFPVFVVVLETGLLGRTVGPFQVLENTFYLDFKAMLIDRGFLTRGKDWKFYISKKDQHDRPIVEYINSPRMMKEREIPGTLHASEDSLPSMSLAPVKFDVSSVTRNFSELPLLDDDEGYRRLVALDTCIVMNHFGLNAVPGGDDPDWELIAGITMIVTPTVSEELEHNKVKVRISADQRKEYEDLLQTHFLYLLDESVRNESAWKALYLRALSGKSVHDFTAALRDRTKLLIRKKGFLKAGADIEKYITSKPPELTFPETLDEYMAKFSQEGSHLFRSNNTKNDFMILLELIGAHQYRLNDVNRPTATASKKPHKDDFGPIMYTSDVAFEILCAAFHEKILAAIKVHYGSSVEFSIVCTFDRLVEAARRGMNRKK